ncbi:MAG: VWA domain-containing protein [bacterium]|nr:VWA domain-containing protein [bacterium]
MKQRVVTFDIQKTENIDELSGKLSSDTSEKKLMRSVLEHDEGEIENGKLIADSLNQGLSSFTPDMMFEQMVKNYSLAKNIYGESLIRRITGHSEGSLKRNLRIPEFQRELKKKMMKKKEELKDKGLIDAEGISEQGISLASVVMCMEELDNILPRGVTGDRVHKKTFAYGLREDTKDFKKERYRDIALRKTIKKAIRRKHGSIQKGDLASFERKSKGQCYIIYGLDASASMKGEKLSRCKRAGMVMAHKAIEEKDKVGVIVFGSKIKKSIPPTDNFSEIIKELMAIKASTETNINATIQEAVKLFPNKNVTKHLILITDAMPTSGEKPEEDTLEAVAYASANDVTVSLVGIKLEEKGKKLAEKITELGKGRLYIVKDLEELGAILLQDYYSVA